MANMTAAALYIYVLEILKRTDKSTEVYKSMTDAIKDLTNLHPFNEMKVEAFTTGGITSATDYRVELPSDFQHLIGHVRLIDGDDSTVLTKLNKPQFDIKYPYLSNTDTVPGIPKHYCYWNTQILIGPIPDDTTYGYEISYARKQTADIDSNTTSVPLTNDYREMVRAGVLARVFEGMEDYEKAAYWHARYDRNLQIVMKVEMQNAYVATNVAYTDV